MNEIPKNKIVRKFVSDVFNEADSENNKVIIIREGDAPKQLDAIKPSKVDLVGTIKAPSEFFKKRVEKELHSKDKCHVLYNKDKATIKLVIDEQFKNDNYTVIGCLLDNPDLVKFGINSSCTIYGIKDLMEKLKFSRMFFKDKEENMSLVAKLQNFRAKAEQHFTNSDDQKGNSEVARITKLEHDLDLKFTLKIPIFKGEEDSIFIVDILANATSSGVNLYLESRELDELQKQKKRDVIKEELKNFDSIVCIEE